MRPHGDLGSQERDFSVFEIGALPSSPIIPSMVENIVKTGANVVFVQKGIDDLAQHFLAKAGIYTVRPLRRATWRSCPALRAQGLSQAFTN